VWVQSAAVCVAGARLQSNCCGHHSLITTP